MSKNKNSNKSQLSEERKETRNKKEESEEVESESSSSSSDTSSGECENNSSTKATGEEASSGEEEESSSDSSSAASEKKTSSKAKDSSSEEEENSASASSSSAEEEKKESVDKSNSVGFTVFMKNFGPAVTDEQIRKDLEALGTIRELRVPRKRDQSKNRGFLICCFEKKTSVQKALEFNGKTFLNCTIYVEELKDGLKNKADFKEEKQQKISERPSRSERGERAILFVGNLPYELDEYAFKKYIEEQGNVLSIRIPQDKETGRKRGFAFFELVDKKEMESFLKKNLVWDERKLNMRPSEPSYRDNSDRDQDNKEGGFKRRDDNDRGFKRRDDNDRGFKRRDDNDRGFKRRDDNDRGFKRRDDNDRGFKKRDDSRGGDRFKSNNKFDNGRKENFGNNKRNFDDKQSGKKIKFDDSSD